MKETKHTEEIDGLIIFTSPETKVEEKQDTVEELVVEYPVIEEPKVEELVVEDVNVKEQVIEIPARVIEHEEIKTELEDDQSENIQEPIIEDIVLEEDDSKTIQKRSYVNYFKALSSTALNAQDTFQHVMPVIVNEVQKNRTFNKKIKTVKVQYNSSYKYNLSTMDGSTDGKTLTSKQYVDTKITNSSPNKLLRLVFDDDSLMDIKVG